MINARRALLASLILCLPTGSLAQSVAFYQTETIAVSPIPTSDADWDQACDAGMTPYQLPLDISLAETGTVIMSHWLLSPANNVVERRGTQRQIASGGLAARQTVPKNGVVRVRAPATVTGILQACGFRKNLVVVDGYLSIDGRFGEWSVSEQFDAVLQDTEGYDYVHSRFVSRIHGSLLHTKNNYPSDQTRIWGKQTFMFEFDANTLTNSGVQLESDDDVEVRFDLVVVDP